VGGASVRTLLKRALARFSSRRRASGVTILTYHRVGGGSPDELDLDAAAFSAQVDVLADADVVSLDEATRRLDVGDRAPCVVLTFDDGFADVYHNAWPLLRQRRLPFTLFLATKYVGGQMQWPGSTAMADGAALSWAQVSELVSSGLCTIGNHTHSHVPPQQLTCDELDVCSAGIERHLGVRPQHFAYPWGVPVDHMQTEMRRRFRTAATGVAGRNLPGRDLMRLRRVPVRRTDPLEFFRAKLTGLLVPERTYGVLVASVKRAGLSA
jgi:peptidoglycan/xylan/chitin deacetylase (PgdA/CDA1 family)